MPIQQSVKLYLETLILFSTEWVLNSYEKLLYKNENGRIDLQLGSGENVSIREVLEYLKKLTESNSEICFGAVPERKYEPSTVANVELMS